MDVSWIAEDLRPLAVSIADLFEDPSNARAHSPRNIEEIKASLRDHGQRKPVVATSGGRIIAGNGTLQAAVALGHDCLAVSRYDAEQVEQLRYALRDNRTAELAEWDLPVLERIGQEIELTEVGWSEAELEYEWGALEPAGNIEGDQSDEWTGMPDFENETEPVHMRLIVNVLTEAAMKSLAELLGQTITRKTKSITYPHRERANLKDFECR